MRFYSRTVSCLVQKIGFVVLIFISSIALSGCSFPSLLDWKVKAGLQVVTANGSASIFLDGKYLDKTPYINKELQPGDYTLDIRPDDATLTPYQTRISLKKGILTVLTWKAGTRPETSGGVLYEMEQLQNPSQTELSINTVPDGAIVKVDDKSQGYAPTLVSNISAGEHSYEVALPSYETQKNTINVLAGYRMNVSVKLAKEATAGDATKTTSSLSTLATGSASGSATSTNSATSPLANVSAGGNAIVQPPKVKILSTHFFSNGKEVLRVRQTPTATGTELGMAPVGAEYPYLNTTQDGWYKISFNGNPGWVSTTFSQLIQ